MRTAYTVVAITIAAMASVVALGRCTPASARTIRFELAPATSPGIGQAPAGGFNRLPTIHTRPVAGIGRVIGGEAPPNGCEAVGGGFLVESGPTAGACIGGR